MFFYIHLLIVAAFVVVVLLFDISVYPLVWVGIVASFFIPVYIDFMIMSARRSQWEAEEKRDKKENPDVFDVGEMY